MSATSRKLIPSSGTVVAQYCDAHLELVYHIPDAPSPVPCIKSVPLRPKPLLTFSSPALLLFSLPPDKFRADVKLLTNEPVVLQAARLCAVALFLAVIEVVRVFLGG